MLERIMREYQPAPRMPSVSAGRTRCAERAVAAHRKPVEVHREDVEQQDADHELRRRDATTKEATISPWSTPAAAPERGEKPMVRPMTISQKIAPAISSRVAGSRDQMSVATSVRCR